MLLQYFVTENKTGACIPVEITPATQSDLLVTKSGWQSDWTSDFIRDSQLEKRVAKAASGEIIALGAYREDQNGISIFIVNMEAHPQSNPTLTDQRKYTGIGRMMIAYGIQLSIDSGHGGVVTFAAKTDELYEHYIQDFHAVPIFQPLPGGPKLLMLADEGAQEIFSTYLSREQEGLLWQITKSNCRSHPCRMKRWIILISCFPSASVSTPIIIMQHKKSVILLMLLPAMSTS